MGSYFAHFATRIAYIGSQLPRVAWYAGHGEIMRRLAKAARQRGGESKRPRPSTQRPVPDRQRLYADMAALFMQDLANVEAKIYPLPFDHDGSLPMLLERSRMFFDDLPQIHRRREGGHYRQVLNEETRRKRPHYYLQNFHFQSGGWMTRESAQRYDTQVEVLLNGTANATRRQALIPMREIIAGRDQRRLRFLDVGCGTGRFLDSFKQVWPRLPTLGIDLSEAYVEEARRYLRHWCWIKLIVANGEAIPLADQTQDAVTSMFLFHELPPKVRRVVLREFARVLKPGGRLVLVDSLQTGDEPDYDGMLELFPQSYHEPYYLSYLKEDFGTLARGCDLSPVRNVNAFVSKVMVFDKRR
jgi:ubiquinone/menaquinone biosynthesis C-methylase UbiE